MGKELPIRATFFLRQQGRGGQWVELIRFFTGQEKEKTSPFSSYASGEHRSPLFPSFAYLSASSFLLPYTAVSLGVRESRCSSKESVSQNVWELVKKASAEEENPWLPLLKHILSPLDIMEKVCF